MMSHRHHGVTVWIFAAIAYAMIAFYLFKILLVLFAVLLIAIGFRWLLRSIHPYPADKKEHR